MELSIIMINHNTKNLTMRAVESLLQTIRTTQYEIIVVDNSTIEEEKLLVQDERIRLLSGVENKGFGNACNYGARFAKGTYILFLNSDVVMQEHTVDQSLFFLKRRPRIGALGVRMLRPDGRLDHGCKRGFPTPLSSLYYFSGLDKLFPNSKRFGKYRQTFLSETSVAEVDSISGAYMLLPKTIFEQLDGFDERFFMYGEDVDLCYRIKEAGYQVIYYGRVSFVHLHGQSGLVRDEKIIGHFYDAMRLFYEKHYRRRYGRITRWMVHTGISIKRRMTITKNRRALQNGRNSNGRV